MTTSQFQKHIFDWYKKHRRDFPWRRTRDPYKILVSEIMLQQTQTSRVKEKYPLFVTTFPTFKTLAHAPLKRVLKTWQGMGYNRRALHIRRISEIVEKEWQGKLPSDPKSLEALPGIGHYTSRAVACFAFSRCEPFLDTNIRRVFIHFFFPRKKKVQDEEILKKITQVQPERNLREWYSALMDYGATQFSKTPNPNKKSVGWRRQTKFEGSKREIRSHIIKELLKTKLTSSQLQVRLQKDKTILKDILSELEKERLIKKRNSLWEIA